MSQKPGIKPGLDLGTLGLEEAQIANLFSKVWFVTFTRLGFFKNYNYPFIFAKPTDTLVDAFHLGREVLVLFCPSTSFDTRAFDFVDKTMGDFENRLDKLCIVLISKDPQIKDKIKQISLQEKESRITVPFTYQEVLDSKSLINDLIISRLKSSFYERDLFALDSPLRNDTYFFGRHQIVQSLYGKYKSGENGCLFGLRRIGKTSVLYAVMRSLETRGEPVLFLDCSETAFHLRRWNEALFFIIDNFTNTLQNRPENLNLHKEIEYDEKNASRSFEEDLRNLYRVLGKKRLLFIFDEIENITFDISPTDHWASDNDFLFFWQSIRSVFQKNPGLFSFIIAGVNPKAIETPTVFSHDNPIYRYVTPVYLSLFDVQEVKEMVSSIGNYMGLVFDEEVFTYFVDDFGGHPFLIRQVCSVVHKDIKVKRPFTVTKFFYSSKRENLVKSIQDYIRLIINILKEKYPIEYELLEYLAIGDNDTFNEFADASFSLIQHLDGYGLIKQEGENYHFRIKSVADYLIAETKKNRLLNSKEDRWAEISEKRNKLETNLRQVIRTNLKVHFGISKAKQNILGIISNDKNRSEFDELNYDQIFEKKLYFNDLKKIVTRNWELFEHIFNRDKDHFQYYMENVNKLRVDAHANDIDDELYASVIIALRWLNDRVNSYL